MSAEDCPDCGGTGDDPEHTWANGDIPNPSLAGLHAACERCDGSGEVSKRGMDHAIPRRRRMVNKTGIEWTDYSANPVKYRDRAGKSVWACVRTSPGCAHCYSADLAKRYRRGGEFTAAEMAGYECYLDDGELRQMLSPKRLPSGSRCFVGDMTDVFGEWVPFEYLDRLFAVFALRPDVVFQVLTKRPERMRKYLTKRDTSGAVAITIREVAPDGGLAAMQAMGTHVLRDVVQRRWPLPNVWLGTSTENQHWADIRVPELLATPAAVRFVSAEPLLGPVVLTNLECFRDHFETESWDMQPVRPGHMRGLDWVVTGGESGPRARPCDLAWLRGIVEQCRAAGVACFVKQLGVRPFTSDLGEQFGDRGLGGLKSRKGADMGEWPEDLRVREMPVAAWNA